MIYQMYDHQILGFLLMTLLLFWLFRIPVIEQNYWKMSFNPEPSKQAQEVICSRKIKKPSHPMLIFNNNPLIQTPYQKHFGGLFSDEKLNFGQLLKYIAKKVNAFIGLLHKLQNVLPRRSLVSKYISFIRSHFDYGYVTFD